MRARTEPKTQTVKASEHWSRIVNEVFSGKKRILVEKSGIPVAAIVSPGDLECLEALERQWEEDFNALWRTGEAFKDESPEDIDREVSKAVAAARRELRAEAERLPAKL